MDAKKILIHQSGKCRKSCVKRLLMEAGRQDWEEVTSVSSMQLDLAKSLWHVRMAALSGSIQPLACVRPELSPTK